MSENLVNKIKKINKIIKNKINKIIKKIIKFGIYIKNNNLSKIIIIEKWTWFYILLVLMFILFPF